MRKSLIIIAATLALLFSAQVFCLISTIRDMQDEVKVHVEKNDATSRTYETESGFFQIIVRGTSVRADGYTLQHELKRNVLLFWTWESKPQS